MSGVDINRVRMWALAFEWPLGSPSIVSIVRSKDGFHPYITSGDVLALLDRLQAAEAAVERVRATLADPKHRWWHTGGTECSPLYAVRDALDGPQDAATGEVALGSTDEPRGPQIAECGRRHPGTCAWIGKGLSLPPICLQPESPASGAESDHGGRGDGEGLG